MRFLPSITSRAAGPASALRDFQRSACGSVALEYSVIVGVIAVAIISSGGGAGGGLSIKLTQVTRTMMPDITTAMTPAPQVARGQAYNALK